MYVGKSRKFRLGPGGGGRVPHIHEDEVVNGMQSVFTGSVFRVVVTSTLNNRTWFIISPAIIRWQVGYLLMRNREKNSGSESLLLFVR